MTTHMIHTARLSPRLQAFIKLESLPAIPAPRRDEYADLAMSIFLKNAPVDPRALRETRDKQPGAAK